MTLVVGRSWVMVMGHGSWSYVIQYVGRRGHGSFLLVDMYKRDLVDLIVLGEYWYDYE